MELNLARDMRDKKRGFYKYKGDKKKTRENVGPLLTETGHLFPSDMEKAEVLNGAFASVLNSQSSFPLGAQPLHWEMDEEEQNEALGPAGKS